MSGLEQLQQCLTEIDATVDTVDTLRARRAQLVADLQADGWTLQRIADATGRSKQAIAQWAAYRRETS